MLDENNKAQFRIEPADAGCYKIFMNTNVIVKRNLRTRGAAQFIFCRSMDGGITLQTVRQLRFITSP